MGCFEASRESNGAGGRDYRGWRSEAVNRGWQGTHTAKEKKAFFPSHQVYVTTAP